MFIYYSNPAGSHYCKYVMILYSRSVQIFFILFMSQVRIGHLPYYVRTSDRIVQFE